MEIRKNREYLLLLTPIYAINHKGINKIITTLFQDEDIEKAITSFKRLSGFLAQSPSTEEKEEKRRVLQKEIAAKISVLRAIPSGKASDWEGAAKIHFELKLSLDSLALTHQQENEEEESLGCKICSAKSGELRNLCLKQIPQTS